MGAGGFRGQNGIKLALVLKSDTLRDMNRRVRRVIIAIPVIAVMSCLLTMADSRLGILVWMVFPFAGIIIRRKKRTT